MPIEFTISDNTERKPKLIPVNICKLERETGYTKGHLSRVFNRKTKPSLTCLGAIAKSLGLTLDQTWKKINGRKFSVK